ncbi:MAG: class I SAM-dependent methyltransferase [Gammaproteobacteria bacterium]|nr:class I SAM-dependent methyltransferase [Gammaproteobacteria bacterium]MDH4255129.1 class I SAM-dependent methyltransferase [Gammaproteobacteria bacterium]MDH5309837.1 class I SAM-dependent methyltransferase [Gammaproteobacteria bacterium]
MHANKHRSGAGRRAVQAFLGRQFGNPSGVAGRLAGWLMETRPSNRRRNEWTVDLLDIQPRHRVLELGYGPGIALRRAAGRAEQGLVVGIDRSATMHELASRRNRDLVEAGRVDLNIGAVERMDEVLGDEALLLFDRVFAVNAIMFWQEPAARIRELAARLAPGGRMAFTWQPRLGDQTDEAALRTGLKIEEWLRDAGLTGLRIERLPELTPMAVCVLGDKAPA